MINVLVADDHPVVRLGIRQIVAQSQDIAVVAEAASGPEVLGAIRRIPLDLVLLDLTMPGADGLDVLKELKREHPQVPVIILTMHSEDQFAIRALKAGAAGYLTKESAPDELVGAIRKVAAGGRYISPWLAEKLAAHLGLDSEKPAHEKLSDREYQILHINRIVAQREDGRHLSRPGSRKNEHEIHRRARRLRCPQQACGLTGHGL
jgi:two-component system invasion response regulator UvrY